MKYDNVNVIEDIPRFIGEDSEQENFFPTFYIHNIYAYLLLWTGDAENYMFDINSEMCLPGTRNQTRCNPKRKNRRNTQIGDKLSKEV